MRKEASKKRRVGEDEVREVDRGQVMSNFMVRIGDEMLFSVQWETKKGFKQGSNIF